MANEDLPAQEKLIEQHMRAGNSGEAIALLAETILAYVRTGNFAKADSLYELMHEADSMAISQIVRVGEAIDEAKHAAIDTGHTSRWAGLYTTLSREDQNALFFSLQAATVQEDKIILQQGKQNNKLFFVEKGSLNLFHQQGNREIFIKSLSPGAIAGSDSFFNASICTSTLITLCPVKVRFLNREKLSLWQQGNPHLLSTLTEFCQAQDDVRSILQEKGVERRRQNRLKISGKVSFQLLDAAGLPLGKTVVGELFDISSGGLSFFFRFRNQESARKLLGRRLSLKFDLPQGPGGECLSMDGFVLGVCHNPLQFIGTSEYSIHIKFTTELSDNLMRRIEKSTPGNAKP